MSNGISEGKDRELSPDEHGEIKRAPKPAILDLREEILEASQLKDAGQLAEMRARSSIDTRANLRIAATSELVDEPTGRKSTLGAAPAQPYYTVKEWRNADDPDGIVHRFTDLKAATEKAEALGKTTFDAYDREGRWHPIAQKPDGQWVRSETLAEKWVKGLDDPSREASSGPRSGNEAGQPSPDRATVALTVEQDIARRWADLDASDYGRLRSPLKREAALDAIAGHMRASPQYEEEMTKRSPVLAEAARNLTEEEIKLEREAARQRAEQDKEAQSAESKQRREAMIDATALAAVATARARETARVADQFGNSPDTATQQRLDAEQSLKAPPLDGRVTAPDDPDIAAQLARTIKRPVKEDELSESLLARYIVSHEKRGLLDKGATEFTFRSGDHEGRVAFVDRGKTLHTERDDKSTIRAMIEVATAKHWKEITVSGSDDFRRQAWVEASLNGIKVHGYKPREADLQLLDDIRSQRQATNSVTVLDRDLKRETGTAAPAARHHIDGDALSPHQKAVLDNSRAILNAKHFGERYTESVITELENKLRGERTYIGIVVDHGKSPYQFNKDNDASYYVTLKTRAGEQVVWGKGLADAMAERKIGEEIVLRNTGKASVTVNEKIRNEQGEVVGVRPKGSHLNAWTAEPLSRFSEKDKAEAHSQSVDRKPAFQVYDPNAARSPERSFTPPPVREQQRNAEVQRGARER